MHTMAIDWGDAPTWLSAVTTLGALIAAGWVVAIELRRDNRAEKARESAEQADRVAAWVSDTADGLQAHVLNGSDLPIYHVAVGVVGTHALYRQQLEIVAVVPPGEHVRAFKSAWKVSEPTEWIAGIGFRDASDRWWYRDERGNLRRVGGPQAMIRRDREY